MKIIESEFLQYLIDIQVQPGERLPTLKEMSDELGISVGKLREQLEVARHLGFVSVRPRLGIVRESFNYTDSVLLGMMFSLNTGDATFAQVSQMRVALETSLWHEAVVLLTPEDKIQLREIVDSAWDKLRGHPIHVPNGEHCQFHLAIFSRLENPFVQGLLNAYWSAYAASELTRFASYQYWLDVWTYHERIVEALCQEKFEQGRKLLVEHFSLLPTVAETL